MPNLNATLDALSARHAAEVASLTDRTCDSARAAYAALETAPTSERYARLRDAVLGHVESARKGVRDLAAAHILDQLRAVTSSRSLPPIALAKDPVAAEVVEYVDNAIKAAEQASERGEAIETTSWWADRVIESEAFRTYDHARRVAESSLRSLPDETAQQYGFQVARSLDNGAARAETEGLIPLLGKRWDAVNDMRTCEVCKAAHGSLGLVGLDFGGTGNPPAHARCRCVTTLWAVGYVKERHMGNTTQTRDLRYACELDTRELDGSARVIRNATASDETLDSHGSIIKSDGWDLTRFRKNPILLWNHQSHGGPENVLGRVEARIDKKGNRLAVDLHFAPAGENALADMVWGQIQRKEVSGLSVGFRPRKYHFEKADGSDEEVMVFDEVSLAELSVVPVPSNENTLTEQVRSMLNATPAKADKTADSDVTSAVADRSTVLPDGQGKQVVAMSDKAAQLPPEIAAILGTESVEDAKRMIAKDRLRIEQLEADVAREAAAAKDAVDALDKYRNEAADAEVESLVRLGIIKEDNRATAQAFARSDLAGFVAMYAEQRERLAAKPPKAHLLEQVVESKNERAPAPKPFADYNAKLRAIKARIMREDPRLSLQEAYERAAAELESEVSR